MIPGSREREVDLSGDFDSILSKLAGIDSYLFNTYVFVNQMCKWFLMEEGVEGASEGMNTKG